MRLPEASSAGMVLTGIARPILLLILRILSIRFGVAAGDDLTVRDHPTLVSYAHWQHKGRL